MHDLWIFPAPRASRWFARQDWYLNWQMSKGLSYAGLHLSEELTRVADRHGIPIPATPGARADLLVLPGSLVPTKKCLVIDDVDESLDTWFSHIAARATELRAETARIFLPTGRSTAEAEAAWARINPSLEAQFEPDLEAAR
jgi:hypothetical protein